MSRLLNFITILIAVAFLAVGQATAEGWQVIDKSDGVSYLDIDSISKSGNVATVRVKTVPTEDVARNLTVLVERMSGKSDVTPVHSIIQSFEVRSNRTVRDGPKGKVFLDKHDNVVWKLGDRKHFADKYEPLNSGLEKALFNKLF